MKVPRQGSWVRRKPSSDHSDGRQDALRAAREEADAVVERERGERRTMRGEDLQKRLRDGARETGRRLRPVGHGLRAFLGRIAPPITRGLLALVRIPVALVVKLQELGSGAVGWAVPRVRSAGSSFAAFVERVVTPVNTVAFVCLVAAVCLGLSQFMDYRGVAVGADLYEGEVGTVAPAPLRDVETAGSAHLFVLLPVAVAAIALTVLIALGRRGLWRWLCGLGVVTLLVTLAIDLPTGLEAGTQGGAYASSDVEMLDGFWIQLFSGAVIALCGYLLGRYTAEEAQPAPTTSFAIRRTGRDPTPGDDPTGPGSPPWKASA